VIAVCLLALAGVGGALAQSREQDRLATEVEQRIVEGSNRLRRDAGVDEVKAHPRLQAAARGFAAFMARTDRYGHEADGQRPVQRTREAGYADCMVSENIAYQFSSAGFIGPGLAGDFVKGWRDSPGHRRNMLDPDATDTGVGVARAAGSGRYYAVQLFGRPRALMVRFAISNRTPQAVTYRIDSDVFPLAPNVTRTHERCRRSPLLMELPGQAEPTRLEPADGERWRVLRVGARWRVERE
jgi:uncharacterized protein YkwD